MPYDRAYWDSCLGEDAPRAPGQGRAASAQRAPDRRGGEPSPGRSLDAGCGHGAGNRFGSLRTDGRSLRSTSRRARSGMLGRQRRRWARTSRSASSGSKVISRRGRHPATTSTWSCASTFTSPAPSTRWCGAWRAVSLQEGPLFMVGHLPGRSRNRKADRRGESGASLRRRRDRRARSEPRGARGSGGAAARRGGHRRRRGDPCEARDLTILRILWFRT